MTGPTLLSQVKAQLITRGAKDVDDGSLTAVRYMNAVDVPVDGAVIFSHGQTQQIGPYRLAFLSPEAKGEPDKTFVVLDAGRNEVSVIPLATFSDELSRKQLMDTMFRRGTRMPVRTEAQQGVVEAFRPAVAA